MKNITKAIVKKAMVAVFAIMGVMAACAELMREDLMDDNGNVVGYKVTGLGDDKNETAVVFTADGVEIPWTVPYDLENVEFLVVGGGGGGGASNSSKSNVNARGGAGGGGGGIVAGSLVNAVRKGSRLLVAVGKGGEGGAAGKTPSGQNTGGAESKGGYSWFSVDGNRYVYVEGGGRDLGEDKSGGNGGSCAGGRTTKRGTTSPNHYTVISNQYVSVDESMPLGNWGGTCYSDAPAAAAGGGGACGEGSPSAVDKNGSTTTHWYAGDGGQGLISFITGEPVMYGSGGGGGVARKSSDDNKVTAGKAYDGAGAGATNGNGRDGLANQGGGGGGGGRAGNGGNGGSGVVVLRYKHRPVLPVVNLIYNGNEQVGIYEVGFEVIGGTKSAREVGTYTAILRPKGDGFWFDGTEGDITVTWKIWPKLPENSAVDLANGYIARGLGENGNEIAVVFTNENAEVINWIAPTAVNNAQFLVVGGGGGGGADTDDGTTHGGAGGGGGGVVTGLVNFVSTENVGVVVGRGGEGGSPAALKNSKYGAADNGTSSSFTVSSDKYVSVAGGGGDNGADFSTNDTGTSGNVGNSGGSSAGSRPGQSGRAEVVSPEAKGVVFADMTFGRKGGAGNTTDNKYYNYYSTAGGGGGATEEGGTPTDSKFGGKGGAGVLSVITGEPLVYGSGGGGGTINGLNGGEGGEGAGSGNVAGVTVSTYAYYMDAAANQGGGGGGGSRAIPGGNGGSGIVAFRFEYNEVASVDGYGYLDLGEAISAAEAGETVTLLANAGNIELGKSIALNLNGYTVDQITLTDAAVTLTAPAGLNVITTVANSEVKFENGVYTVVASVFTVALPTVENATWSYNGTPVTGPITVNKGTNVELTLSAADGYQFANGQTSVTVTFENVNDNIAADNSAFASITAPQKPAVAKIGEMKFGSVSSALDYAYNNNLKDVVITLCGVTAANTTDSVNLYNNYGNGSAFNNITFNQEDSSKPYYLNCLYTGWTTGKVVFDGVNIVVTSQLFAIGNFELINNSTIKRTNDTKNFIFYGNMIINKGSIFESQVDGISSESSLTVDGGTYKTVFLTVESGNTFTVVNGANVLITNYEFSGDLTVNGVLNIDCNSTINAMRILGAGKIIVDATGMTEGDEISLTANLANFTGTLETVGNDDLEVSIVDGKIVLVKKEVVLAGSGTQADPYLIKNIDDLVLFRDSVNAGETKYNAAGVYVELAADIDMDGVNWVGIGSVSQPHGFMGNFDGKGFKVKNLTITDPALDSDGYAYAGLFAVTEGTDANNQNIIKNLTIENVTISTTGHIVSAAIAYPYYTIVDNVKVCGDINITGGNYTAGALAYTRRCVNASNVSVVGNEGSTITGAQTVGGVISDIQMNGGLTAVYSNFSAENLTITGTKQVGGISGIIATQTLNGATVKNVTINCADRAGQVAGSFGGTCTISNIVVENVAGTDAIIGGGYDGSKPVEAKLGDTFYSTFAEAYSKATAGDTLSLLADIEASEVILLDKNLTINGNGHKVTSSATRVFRVTTADTEVTLNDVNMVSTAVRVGTNDIRGISIDNVNNVKLTLNNCSVDFADASANDWAYAVNVTGGSNHILTVNGGTYEGANVINVRGANNTVAVKNATLNSLYPDDDQYYGAGIWVEQEKGSSVEATGNTFEGSNAVAFNVGSGTVLAESNNTDNTSLYGVAKVGDTMYATLSEAFAAVQDGETVKLLADVVASETITVAGKSITLDLNGKTISGVCNAEQSCLVYVENNAALTVKDSAGNGKLTYAQGTRNVGWTVDVKGAFVLESGTIELTGSWSIGYAVDVRPNAWGTAYVNPTVFTMNGGNIVSSDGGVRVASSSSDIYKNVSASFVMNGGKIDAAWDGVFIQQSDAIYDNLAFEITGGTIESDLNPVRVYGPAPTGYVSGQDCMNIALKGGALEYTGTESYEWVVDGILRVGGGSSAETIVENGSLSVSGEIAADSAAPEGFKWESASDGMAVLVAKPTAADLPDAEVTNLGSITVGLGDYKADAYMMYDIINGGKLQEATVPYDLTLAMDFKAKDTAETAAQNAFGNYTTDFFITMSGMSQASFVGDGCYLAGYYPSFKAWVKIPLDGFTVENGKVYPVITSAGFDFKYTDICGTVGQFICGIYLTPEVLAANPNLSVDLTLGLAENKEAALNAQFFKVDNYIYDADDLQPVTLPEVVITDIKNTLTDADPDLTFALNFAIKDVDKLSEEYLEKLFAKYGDYYTDYVLTISGLTDPNGSVKFNANGNGDGYLAGQYDAWSKSWVTVPFSDVTVTNGQSFYIMEYAAELMGKGGLRLTLKEIAEIVKNFDCGVYFTPEFLAANPNLKVELELKVFTEDENGNKVGDISVATNTFDKDDFSVEAAKLDIRIVNGKPQIGFAGEGKLVLNAATALTGEWTKNVEYTAVENDGDDTKTWVTPAEGYYFFKGYIVR